MPNISKELIGDFIDAACGNHQKAKDLLIEYPELLESRWMLQETPLHFCVVENFIEGVRFLLENGANPNSMNEFDETPRIDAAILGRADIIKLLISAGANINIVSKTRGSVLMIAVNSGNPDAVQHLLVAGADYNFRTADLDESVHDVLPKDPQKRNAVLAVLKSFGCDIGG